LPLAGPAGRTRRDEKWSALLIGAIETDCHPAFDALMQTLAKKAEAEPFDQDIGNDQSATVLAVQPEQTRLAAIAHGSTLSIKSRADS
jgi:hypothetical protein